MKFNLFVQALEKRLGNHHIPVNRDAVLLQDLFANSPVHAEFVTNLIRTIYKKNNCQNLGSPITKSVVNQVLAKSRLSALQAKHTDIDTFNFIEDMCLAVDAIFKETSQENELNDKSTVPGTATKINKASKAVSKTIGQDGVSNVVAIEHKRHLRWLKSSA